LIVGSRAWVELVCGPSWCVAEGETLSLALGADECFDWVVSGSRHLALGLLALWPPRGTESVAGGLSHHCALGIPVVGVWSWAVHCCFVGHALSSFFTESLAFIFILNYCFWLILAGTWSKRTNFGNFLMCAVFRVDGDRHAHLRFDAHGVGRAYIGWLDGAVSTGSRSTAGVDQGTSKPYSGCVFWPVSNR